MIDSDRDIMNAILWMVRAHNIQNPCHDEIKDSLTRYLNRNDIVRKTDALKIEESDNIPYRWKPVIIDWDYTAHPLPSYVVGCECGATALMVHGEWCKKEDWVLSDVGRIENVRDCGK